MIVRTRVLTVEVTSNFGCFLKVKWMGTAAQSVCGCETKRRIQYGMKALGLNN